MTDSKFLQVAKQAAIEAGKIVKKYYQSELALQDKGHYTNFATKADIESEQKVIEIITKNFPDHNIVGEESGEINNNSDYTWAIDPIDGTIPFVDGIPFFGVSVGLLKNNQPFVGVINMVGQEDLYWAEDGKGAFKNGKKIKVSKESNLEQSTLALEFGHTNRDKKLKNHFVPVISKIRYAYVFGSAVKSLTLIAQGNLEGALISAYIWDFAASAILVKEAGGKVTNQKGEEPDFTLKHFELLFSNNMVHDDLVKIYKQ
jgi:myo-inositol-1(or 4)-monophosphatase